MGRYIAADDASIDAVIIAGFLPTAGPGQPGFWLRKWLGQNYLAMAFAADAVVLGSARPTELERDMYRTEKGGSEWV